MTARQVPETSLRLDRLDWTRLAWLLALSALIHLAAWGGYEAGKKLGIWDKLHLPAWARTINEKIVRNIEQPKSELPDQQPPLVFVEVNPMQATPEPPKNARYYSSRNSQAANPDTDKDTGVADPFLGQVMSDIDRSRRKIILAWSCVGVALFVGAWLVSGPLMNSVGIAMRILPDPLVEMDNNWLSQLISPVNSVAGVVALVFLGLRLAYRKIFS